MSRYQEAPVWFNYNGAKVPGKKPEKECVLVDLDGTLLDNEHRQHFMQGKDKRWAPFFDAMRYDGVHPEVRFITNLIFAYSTVDVICVTGRPSQYHGMTLQSLHDNGCSFTALIMRAQTDNRPDAYVKRSMLDGILEMGFKPILCIDDRPEVVHMWRMAGVRTLACDPGPWREHVISTQLMDKLLLVDENQRLQHRIEELENEASRRIAHL
jgi:hypothetical protein